MKLKGAIVPSRSATRTRTGRRSAWMAAAAAALVVAEIAFLGALAAHEEDLQSLSRMGARDDRREA